MKRLTTVLLFIFSVLLLSAQTQYGYVKTKGRLGADGNVIPGVRLSGATVSIKDRSALISASDGGFSFPLPGKAYIVQSVSKNGYLLTDAEQLRSYGYSSNPLILVMETPEQQNEDRLMAERKINRTLRRTLQQREDELDSLREANRITKEEYDKLYAQLYDDEERNRKLINEMVERYAKMDFDQMDERNREIKACILNGELLKADSLINSKGSLDTRIMEYNRLREANAHEEEELKKRSETLVSSLKFEEKTLLELAEDCFNKSEVFKMGHHNDSAAYYLTIRAELDTTNVQWQLEAGRFLDEYLAAYNKALDYYNRGLRHALIKYGEKSLYVATCYNNIGLIYYIFGNNSLALEYYNKALNIWLSFYGEQHPDVSISYNNIGNIYNIQGNLLLALEYYKKAIEIWSLVACKNYSDKVTCYNNVGGIYCSYGDYFRALEYYKKSLAISLNVYGNNHPTVAECYNNIGLLYYAKGDYSLSFEYYEKSLAILLKTYGNNHPAVAECYNNMGLLYYVKRDYSLSLEYYKKSLVILLKTYGDNHPTVAEYYNNIGLVYYNQENYSEALDCFNKALKIDLSFFDKNHPTLAVLYNNIGLVYTYRNEYDKALDYYNKTLKIKLVTCGKNNKDVATSYNNIGGIYTLQNKHKHALENFNNALKIQLSVLGENHSDVARSYSNIGGSYYLQSEYSKALEYLRKSLKIYSGLYGYNTQEADSCSKSIYETYCKLLQQSVEKKKEFEDFMSEYSFTIDIVEGETPASAQGMSGQYYLLEFGDWNIYSTKNLFDKNTELQGKPKDIVVMKDGAITKHHLEDKVDCQISLKYVGKEEKQRIVKSYKKWKNK